MELLKNKFIAGQPTCWKPLTPMTQPLTSILQQRHEELEIMPTQPFRLDFFLSSFAEKFSLEPQAGLNH